MKLGHQLKKELDSCPKIILTSHREWNPKSVALGETQTIDGTISRCEIRLASVQIPVQPT